MAAGASNPTLEIQQFHIPEIQDTSVSALIVDGQWLLVGSSDGSIRFYHCGFNLVSLHTTLQAHTAKVLSCTFSSNSSIFATSSSDGTVKIWHIRGREIVCSRTFVESSVIFCNFAPNCAWVLTVNVMQQFKVWDINTGRCLFSKVVDNDEYGPIIPVVFAQMFNSDSTMSIMPNGADPAEVWFIDINTRQASLVASLGPDDIYMCNWAFSPNNPQVCAVACSNRPTKIWRITRQDIQCLHILKDWCQDKWTDFCRFDATGKRIMTGGFGLVKIWPIDGDNCITTIKLQGSGVVGGQFGLDDYSPPLVIIWNNTVCQFFDADTGNLLGIQNAKKLLGFTPKAVVCKDSQFLYRIL